MALMEAQRREVEKKATGPKPERGSVTSGVQHEESKEGTDTLQQASRCCGGKFTAGV